MKQVLLLLILATTTTAFAQRTCAFEQKRQELFLQHPELQVKYNAIQLMHNDQNSTFSTQSVLNTNTIFTVQVVVHVLYKTAEQNISDAQIASQITVLNNDYNKTNSDFSTVVPVAFQPLAADMDVNFIMATTDPNGQPTMGITRKSVPENFDFYNNYYQFSGEPAWDTEKYLNIWVGDFGASSLLLGFALGPESAGAPDDGLCIDYNNFGTIGTVSPPFNKGRTATDRKSVV